jgi:hypothetical protein
MKEKDAECSDGHGADDAKSGTDSGKNIMEDEK